MLDDEFEKDANEDTNGADNSKENQAQAFSYEKYPKEQELSSYYYYRRIKKNKMERKIRQSRIRLNRLRFLLRIFVISFIIWLCYKTVYMSKWYLEPNIFFTSDNGSLEIVNNKIVPKNKILTALRKTTIPHVPIYKLETDEIRQNVMQLDPINDVYVRRFWFPARLQVIVDEKVPVISISPAENVAPVAFFANDGTLIGREYLPLKPEFKTILVLSYGVRDDDYRNWNLEKIKQIERFAKAVKVYSKEDVKYIDFRNPRDVYVKTDSANIRIGVLDDTAFERIKRISSILPQIKMLDKPIKYIDLRWKDANYIKLDSEPEPLDKPQSWE